MYCKLRDMDSTITFDVYVIYVLNNNSILLPNIIMHCISFICYVAHLQVNALSPSLLIGTTSRRCSDHKCCQILYCVYAVEIQKQLLVISIKNVMSYKKVYEYLRCSKYLKQVLLLCPRSILL